MARSRGIWLALGILLGGGAALGDFLPDPEGWIRHWIIYGPIGILPADAADEEHLLYHPITREPLIQGDLIAEKVGTPGRQTQKNFLPWPGREIAPEFGRILPEHVLREGFGPGINPAAPRLAGIGWVTCDSCTVNFDGVFNFPSPQNDDRGDTDVRGYVVYAYTYVEVLGDQWLEAFISLGSDDAAEVLLGVVPAPGVQEDFLEPIYLANEMRPSVGCEEQDGPEDSPTPIVDLEPGQLYLILVKVLEGPGDHLLRFRFREPDHPYAPITGDKIRIRLSPDPGAPDPALFKRMDADGDEEIALNDLIQTLGWLFLGEEDLPCQDAADANDDGEIDIGDPIATIGHLFREWFPLPPFPRGCCGLDPTPDELPDCPPGWSTCR